MPWRCNNAKIGLRRRQKTNSLVLFLDDMFFFHYCSSYKITSEASKQHFSCYFAKWNVFYADFVTVINDFITFSSVTLLKLNELNIASSNSSNDDKN